jgi:hypothetical protein
MTLDEISRPLRQPGLCRGLVFESFFQALVFFSVFLAGLASAACRIDLA